MRKFIIILIAVFSAVLFTACGDDNETQQPNQSEPQINNETHTTPEPDIISEPDPQPKFITTVLTVKGMRCGRCVNAITNELTPIDGVISVSVDLDTDTVTIEHNSEIDIETIKEIIIYEAGFDIP